MNTELHVAQLAQELRGQAQGEPTGPPADMPDDRDLRYTLTPGLHIAPSGSIEQGTDDFAREALDGLPAGTLYRKDACVGTIREGAFRLAEPNDVRLLVDAHLRLGEWRTSKKDGAQVLIFKATTADNAGLVLAAAVTHPNVRDLQLVTRYPIFDPYWRLCAPGWNERGAIYYAEPDALRGLRPVKNIATIRTALDDLVVDFPFREEADRVNLLGMLLGPLIRPAVNGNVPMHVLTSPLERTGKTKLAEYVFGQLLLGDRLAATQWHEREEENEKRILSMLLRDVTLIHLDNVRTLLESASLASLLTARKFGGRVLGVSRYVELPNNACIVASGNNVAASAEIAKRSIPIRLQPLDDHPEQRTGFQHPDLPRYIDEVRRHVLACLVGAIQLWLQAGRPATFPLRNGKTWTVPPLGGFEGWAECVGGVLGLLGYREWRANETAWHRTADPWGTQIVQFVDQWAAEYPTVAVNATTLTHLARKMNLFPVCFTGRSDRAHVVSFGTRVLRPLVDRPVGQYVVRCDDGRNGALYMLEDQL